MAHSCQHRCSVPAIDDIVAALRKAGYEPTKKIGRPVVQKVFSVGCARGRRIVDELEKWRAANPDAPPPATPAESDETNGNERTISLNGTRIKNEKELAEHCGLDLTEWEIYRFVCNKWEVGAKDLGGKIQVESLFQVKAWLRKRTNLIAVKEEIQAMLAEAKAKAPKFPAIVRREYPDGCLLEPSIYDAHFGKLAWGKETGHEDYDLGIAVKLYDEAVDSLLDRSRSYPVGRIVLPVGNDLLHIDNRRNTTTKGTLLDADSRWPKVFRATRQAIQRNILKMRKVAPVDVVMVPGNHDYDSNFSLGDSLEGWLHNTEDVRVDNEPTPRKFYQYGKVGLLLTHGDAVRPERLPLLFATERRGLWGSTTTHEVHVGHWHKSKGDMSPFYDEQFGVIVRVIPSLCPPDAWHSESGFISNMRRAEAYIWHREEGLVGTAVHSIPKA